MDTTTRQRILKINGVILGLFGGVSFFMLDVLGGRMQQTSFGTAAALMPATRK